MLFLVILLVLYCIYCTVCCHILMNKGPYIKQYLQLQSMQLLYLLTAQYKTQNELSALYVLLTTPAGVDCFSNSIKYSALRTQQKAAPKNTHLAKQQTSNQPRHCNQRWSRCADSTVTRKQYPASKYPKNLQIRWSAVILSTSPYCIATLQPISVDRF